VAAAGLEMLGPSFALPIYLTSCTGSRDAVRDLVSKYSPTDGRFVAYASEARALWHIKHNLRDAMALPSGMLDTPRRVSTVHGVHTIITLLPCPLHMFTLKDLRALVFPCLVGA
jgi:hypothetical protein